jgi:hypothetical protein
MNNFIPFFKACIIAGRIYKTKKKPYEEGRIQARIGSNAKGAIIV